MGGMLLLVAYGPGRYSEAFRKVLLATTRTMVAMDAERGSARTIGLASSMLMLDAVDSVHEVDRTMTGPTSEVWLDPWQRALEASGVRFHFGHRATSIEVDPQTRSKCNSELSQKSW